MFGNQGFDRVRQMFAAQFEPDGNDFIYRKYSKGAPIRVSASERDRYIEVFSRGTKFRSWGIAGGTIFLILALTFYAMETNTDISRLAIFGGLGAMMAAYMASHYRAWNLPARELRDRSTIGEARSRAEMKRRLLAKLTYGEIASVAGTSVILLIQIDSKRDLFSGWNLL